LKIEEFRMWFKSLLCLILLSAVSAQRFLREGFSNSMESDFKGEMKLGESELASGMTREMFLMQGVDWELQPINFADVKDAQLRRHLQGFFKDPIKLKLSKRRGKYGLRAIGELGTGKRLRAYWRQVGGGGRTQSSEFLEMSYDEAVKARLSQLEFEIQLPPLKGSKDLPSVICSVPIEPGTMNGKAIVPRGAGSVKVLPIGHVSGGDAPVMKVGRAHVTLPMKNGIVDPSWARGRTIFRKGRPTGFV
jgi:hypothetical protein